MDNNEGFDQGLYDGVDMWDGLHDDIEKSLSNDIDNISKGYECMDAFTTNEVKLKFVKYI